MNVALIQMLVVKEEETNLKKAEEYIRKAAEQKADVAILPEMFCCPYNSKVFPDYAQPEGGAVWQRLSNAARENNIYLVAGSVPEDEDGKTYNTAYAFDRQGKQIGKHRKMHLFDIDVKGGQRFMESDTLTPGDQVTVFDTEFGKIGLPICYDFRFPELSRLMVQKGADILIVPGAFNMTTGPAHWELHCRSRALDNQVFTIGVGIARDENADYVAWGHSMVVSPWGDIIMEMDEKEGMQLCTLDLGRIAEVREQLPLLKHRRLDLYQLSEIQPK